MVTPHHHTSILDRDDRWSKGRRLCSEQTRHWLSTLLKIKQVPLSHSIDQSIVLYEKEKMIKIYIWFPLFYTNIVNKYIRTDKIHSIFFSYTYSKIHLCNVGNRITNLHMFERKSNRYLDEGFVRDLPSVNIYFSCSLLLLPHISLCSRERKIGNFNQILLVYKTICSLIIYQLDIDKKFTYHNF